MELLGKIITNILTALYEPFGFSLLLSFLAMFFYLYAYEPGEAGKGWKCALVTWYERFKGSVFFRKLFLLAFVTSMIFSVSIETLQLLLRLGTFQLSDIFYNTVGGVIGGLMYYGIRKARKRL